MRRTPDSASRRVLELVATARDRHPVPTASVAASDALQSFRYLYLRKEFVSVRLREESEEATEGPDSRGAASTC